MLTLSLNQVRRWLSQSGRHRRRSKCTRAVAVLSGFEILEGRLLLDAVRWINPGGGAWEVAANWDAGRTPGPDDDVIIDLQGVAVTHTSGSDLVHSLQLAVTTLTLSGGTLDIANGVRGNGTLTLSGGTLTGATVSTGLTFRGAQGTLDGVTVNTNLDMTGQNSQVNITDGLTLNGTLSLGNTTGTTAGQLLFTNSESIDGIGSIILGAGANSLTAGAADVVVTFGPSLTVHGGRADFNAGYSGSGFNNQGTIITDRSGIGITLENCSSSGTIIVQTGVITLVGSGTESGRFSTEN